MELFYVYTNGFYVLPKLCINTWKYKWSTILYNIRGLFSYDTLNAGRVLIKALKGTVNEVLPEKDLVL